MPNNISIASAIDKGKLSSSVIYTLLLELDVIDSETSGIVETVRVAHNDENYVFLGQTYVAMPLEISVTHGKAELPRLTLTVKDPFQLIEGRMQEYGGLLGCPVRIMVVSSAHPHEPEILERFRITGASSSATDYSKTFEIGAENPIAMRFPARKQFIDRCFWKYRGEGCFYTGGLPSCSYAPDGENGCKAHSNIANYGGFRGLRKRNVS